MQAFARYIGKTKKDFYRAILMKKALKLVIGAICTIIIVVGPAYFVHGVFGTRPPLRDIAMYSIIGVFSYIIGVTFKV